MNLFCPGVWWPLTYLFSDLQRSLAQRLCFLVLPSLPIQDSQVIEGGSDLMGTQTHSSYVTCVKPGIFTHVCVTARLHHSDSVPWSGERVIHKEEDDVWKQEVIKVGCNLIPIMNDESPTRAVRKREAPGRSPLISDSDRLWWPCG